MLRSAGKARVEALEPRASVTMRFLGLISGRLVKSCEARDIRDAINWSGLDFL